MLPAQEILRGVRPDLDMCAAACRHIDRQHTASLLLVRESRHSHSEFKHALHLAGP